VRTEIKTGTEIKSQKKLHFLRIIAVWTLVSLLLQSGFYFTVNRAIAKMMMLPSANLKTITATLEAVLPDDHPENLQISYAKDYIAYMSDGLFKVFNLKQNKVVFVKKPDTGSDKEMGIINYQWLRDRNTLIYFFAKKNPSPYTTVLVSDPNTKPSTQNQENPSLLNEESQIVKGQTKEVKVYQPQLTEIYTLDLPNSSDSTPPDDRQTMTLADFPAGGKIEHIASSTYTNLIYLTIKTGASVKLMEIDVNKNTRMLQQAGETLLDITASDRYGTLYIESKTGNVKQILALDGSQRRVVEKNNSYCILGDCAGKLYIGEVKNARLVQIFTVNDSSKKNNQFTLSPTWQGDIPFSNGQVGIDSEGKVVLYENHCAYIISGGKEKTETISGEENYISNDGAVLIQLTHQDGSTKVNISPLN